MYVLYICTELKDNGCTGLGEHRVSRQMDLVLAHDEAVGRGLTTIHIVEQSLQLFVRDEHADVPGT